MDSGIRWATSLISLSPSFVPSERLRGFPRWGTILSPWFCAEGHTGSLTLLCPVPDRVNGQYLLKAFCPELIASWLEADEVGFPYAECSLVSCFQEVGLIGVAPFKAWWLLAPKASTYPPVSTLSFSTELRWRRQDLVKCVQAFPLRFRGCGWWPSTDWMSRKAMGVFRIRLFKQEDSDSSSSFRPTSSFFKAP